MPLLYMYSKYFNIVSDKKNLRRALHEYYFHHGNGCFVSILIVALIVRYTKFYILAFKYLAEFF